MIRSLRSHRKAALFDPSTPEWSLHLSHYVRKKAPAPPMQFLAEDGHNQTFTTGARTRQIE